MVITDELILRDLTNQDDLDQCIALQRATWGDDFRELVPPAVLQIAQKVGGIAAGAFDPDGPLAGFVFGLTGQREGRPVHWSHMLAVREDLRDRGVGRLLKLHQRERMRQLGVATVLWSFDPLVARNAHLNLNRLGTRVLEYVEDMYGDNPMSRTDSVIGSDRFVVSWDISGDDAPPDKPALPPAAPVVSSGGKGALPDLVDEPAVLVEVPPDVQALEQDDPGAALEWRRSTRRAFTHYLGAGYLVAGFLRDRAKQHCHYLLVRPGAE